MTLFIVVAILFSCINCSIGISILLCTGIYPIVIIENLSCSYFASFFKLLHFSLLDIFTFYSFIYLYFDKGLSIKHKIFINNSII